MSFIWPRCCSSSCSSRWVPLYRCRDRRRAAAGRVVRRGRPRRPRGAAAPEQRGASASPGAALPAVLLVVGPDVLALALARPQGVIGRAPAGGHGDPRLRRLGQHGRRPTSRRPGWPRRRPRRRTSSQRQPPGVRHRRRRVQRLRARRPAADQRPGDGRSPRSTASPPRTGTSLGQGHPGVARRDRRRPTTAAPTDYYSNRSPAPTAPADAGPAGHARPGGDRAADRRREQRVAGPARRPPRRPPTAASASTPSGSAAPPARRSTSTASRSTRSSTRPTLQSDRQTHRRHVLRAPPTHGDLRHDLLDLDTQLVVKPEAIELTPLFAGAGLVLLVLGGRALARLARAAAMSVTDVRDRRGGRLMDLPVARPARAPRARARRSSPSTSGASRRRRPAAAATRASRWSAPRRPRSSRLRRHLPFALFAAALAVLASRSARPVAIAQRARERRPRSSCHRRLGQHVLDATSRPTGSSRPRPPRVVHRSSQGATTQIGIVAFSGFAEIVQAPTNDQEALLDALQSLTTGRRTAIGSGILAVDRRHRGGRPVRRAATTANEPTGASSRATGARRAPTRRTSSSCSPTASSNAGPDPLEAAQQAADRGVRVYTIGFGTADGGARRRTAHRSSSAASRATDGFGGGGFGGGGVRGRRRRVPARDRR